ncbi:hypothetical protein ACPV5U_08700 [Vibrio mediterranei]
MTDISVETAVNGLSRTVASQLESIQSLFAKNIANVNEAINIEVTQHNTLVDELEALQSQKNMLELKVGSMADAHKQEIQNLTDQITEFTKRVTSQNIKLGTFSELKKELNELKSLNPKKMQERIARLRSSNDGYQKDLAKIRKDNKQYREENSTLKAANARIEAMAAEVHSQYQEIKGRLIEQDGDVTQKVYAGKNGLECFIYTFGYPLAFKPTSGAINVINDFKFHIEIRTNWAINLIVSCSVWGIPFLPESADLEPHMPNELHGVLQNMFQERMEENHSFLLDRSDWAREQLLEDVEGISSKHVELLNNANYFSVFAASHIPDVQLEANVKGIGKKGIAEIRKAVRAHVEKWERENWEPSLVGKFN